MISNSWNNSVCNPFGGHTVYYDRNHGCEKKYVIAIPETPYIRTVINPLGDNPFIKVDKLRTKIDSLFFQIKEYTMAEDGLIKKYYFETKNYQNYVPDGLFKDGHYYSIICIAKNDSGFSHRSNTYIVDLLHNSVPAYQKIVCGGVLKCSLPILCG